jgi:transposase
MAFIRGEGRSQGTLFPVTLDELIPEDHVGRGMDAFVVRLDVAGLGFERAEAAETGRPGYDPRDLLKLYLYGYLQQIGLLPQAGVGVSAQRRVDVVARTIVSRPQEHR